jgi:hypothetical protein
MLRYNLRNGKGIGDLWEGDHLDDRGVEGRIIIKWIFEKWDEVMDWMDRDRWRALVSVVMNLCI